MTPCVPPPMLTAKASQLPPPPRPLPRAQCVVPPFGDVAGNPRDDYPTAPPPACLRPPPTPPTAPSSALRTPTSAGASASGQSQTRAPPLPLASAIEAVELGTEEDDAFPSKWSVVLKHTVSPGTKYGRFFWELYSSQCESVVADCSRKNCSDILPMPLPFMEAERAASHRRGHRGKRDNILIVAQRWINRLVALFNLYHLGPRLLYTSPC